MEKVSVENNILINPLWNINSTVSRIIGSIPPWWIPIPNFKMFSIFLICGIFWSSSLKVNIAHIYIFSMAFFSSSFVKFNSVFARLLANNLHFSLLKQKIMPGSKSLSVINSIIRLISSSSFLIFFSCEDWDLLFNWIKIFLLLLLSIFSIVIFEDTCDKALLKLSSLKFPFSSTVKRISSLPVG